MQPDETRFAVDVTVGGREMPPEPPPCSSCSERFLCSLRCAVPFCRCLRQLFMREPPAASAYSFDFRMSMAGCVLYVFEKEQASNRHWRLLSRIEAPVSIASPDLIFC